MTGAAATVAQMLTDALQDGVDRLDVQLLLLHALGRPAQDRAWLLTHDNDTVDAERQTAFKLGLQRRGAGEPLAYITGHKEFFGLDLQVDARVLVPRPDTETLVNWALQVLREKSGASVIDLGTGSGAIALAVKAMRPDLAMSATDLSVDALTVARSNAKNLGLNIEFLQGYWLEPTQQAFDLIVSNPPYIAAQDSHLANLRHEPRHALVSGMDGLDDLRQIVMQARQHLKPGGWLLLEHGYDQADAVRQLLRNVGLNQVQSRNDLNGIERCSGGRL